MYELERYFQRGERVKHRALDSGGGCPRRRPARAVAERQRDPERTRSEILEIATREFAKHGYAGARVDDMAERMRTTKRMIYYYFGSKEQLFIAVLEHAYTAIRRAEQEVDVDGLDPASALRRLAELTFDHQDSHPEFIRLVSIENIHRAERARDETSRWLEREELAAAVTDPERTLLEASSGGWPSLAIADGMWRKEGLGALLWGLRHVAVMPRLDDEFEVAVLNARIERYGSVSSFRANGSLRPASEIEPAWLEADAWFGATEGREGRDATVASISAERSRALGWLLDDARPLP